MTILRSMRSILEQVTSPRYGSLFSVAPANVKRIRYLQDELTILNRFSEAKIDFGDTIRLKQKADARELVNAYTKELQSLQKHAQVVESSLAQYQPSGVKFAKTISEPIARYETLEEYYTRVQDEMTNRGRAARAKCLKDRRIDLQKSLMKEFPEVPIKDMSPEEYARFTEKPFYDYSKGQGDPEALINQLKRTHNLSTPQEQLLREGLQRGYTGQELFEFYQARSPVQNMDGSLLIKDASLYKDLAVSQKAVTDKVIPDSLRSVKYNIQNRLLDLLEGSHTLRAREVLDNYSQQIVKQHLLNVPGAREFENVIAN